MSLPISGISHMEKPNIIAEANAEWKRRDAKAIEITSSHARPIAMDTETSPIRPGRLAPPMACLSWAELDGSGFGVGDVGISGSDESEDLLEHCLTSRHTIWANAPFDLAVIGVKFPRLMPVIFDALIDDRVYDVLTRQKLLDLSEGILGDFWSPASVAGKVQKKKKIVYNLSDVHHRLVGTPLDKDNFRLQYGELLDVPVEDWEEGARKYAIGDSIATLNVFLAQNMIPDSAGTLTDQFRQGRGHWALHLISCWGLRTDAAAISLLDGELSTEEDRLRKFMLASGLLRKNLVKNTKLAKSMMYKALADDCTLTKKGKDICTTRARTETAGLSAQDKLLAKKAISAEVLMSCEYKYVSLSADSCERSNSEYLLQYRDYGKVTKLRTTYIPALRLGEVHPIQTRFESLLETGRTSSSSPNIQNPPRAFGVRQCIVPRDGYVFVGCDYDLAELRALAEICLSVVGHSKLASALNAGEDPHSGMVANILGIPYREVMEGRSTGDAETKAYLGKMRTLGKAANFGFPGGLGAETFVLFARGNYGVDISVDETRELKRQWNTTWPEMTEYFRFINSLFPRRERSDDPEKEAKLRMSHRANIEQYRSCRERGRVGYTQACNTFFQGLTADAAKEALFNVAHKQFCCPESSLYGSHNVNFLHDEIHVECKEDVAEAVAWELKHEMVHAYNYWTPNVPMTAEPYIMRRWEKEACAVYDNNGKMIPWERNR